jgi:cysteine-rich repeat protein
MAVAYIYIQQRTCTGTSTGVYSKNSKGITINSNNCNCFQGFDDTNTPTCTEICGDGLLYTLPCDDGNNIDGDGCSGYCQIELGYTCLTGGNSICYNSGLALIKILNITKLTYSNEFIIIMSLIPSIQQQSLIDFADSVSLNQSLTLTSVTYNNNGIATMRCSYTQNLYGLPVILSIYPYNTVFTVQISNIMAAFPYDSSIYTSSQSM